MELLCPKCEKPLAKHIDGECVRKGLTRRFFFGALGGAFAAHAAAKVLPNFVLESEGAGQLVVTATPKVHEWAAIELNFEGTGHAFQMSQNDFIRSVEFVAKRTGRSVVGIHDGKVVKFVDAVEERIIPSGFEAFQRHDRVARIQRVSQLQKA